MTYICNRIQCNHPRTLYSVHRTPSVSFVVCKLQTYRRKYVIYEIVILNTCRS